MRQIKYLFPIIAVIFMLACNSRQSSSSGHHLITTTITASYSDTLYNCMDSVLMVYDQLKNAIHSIDTAQADNYAESLGKNWNNIPLNELAVDSSKYKMARGTFASMAGEIAGLKGEDDLQGKREEFSMISDILYDMIRITGLKNKTIYRYFCATALNGNGAYWLSENENDTDNNPYDAANIHCGEIKETLKFK